MASGNEDNTAAFTKSATISVSFNLNTGAATGAQRHQAVEDLRAQCLIDITPHNAIGVPSAITFAPSASEPASGVWTFPYDPALTNPNLLEQGVTNASSHVEWNGASKLITVA